MRGYGHAEFTRNGARVHVNSWYVRTNRGTVRVMRRCRFVPEERMTANQWGWPAWSNCFGWLLVNCYGDNHRTADCHGRMWPKRFKTAEQAIAWRDREYAKMRAGIKYLRRPCKMA